MMNEYHWVTAPQMGTSEPIILELCFQWVAYYGKIILQRAEPFISRFMLNGIYNATKMYP